MKKIIVILFCCFCRPSYCLVGRDRLTDDEIIDIFGTKNNSAPTYGIVEITFPDGRSKRDISDSLQLSIPFSDGSIKHLNLKLTDGFLANGDTPVWYAVRARNSRRISYTRQGGLNTLGKFSFYQELKTRAAVIVFHDKMRMEGFVDYHRFEPDLRNQFRKIKHKTTYKLVPITEFGQPRTLSVPLGNRGKREADGDDLPTTVYPQILIHMEIPESVQLIPEALIRMLAYWNAVDMMYSELTHPQVKINVAGLIVPLNHLTRPWLAQRRYWNNQPYVDGHIALKRQGEHFRNHSDVFTAENYDFMFSFVGIGLDATFGILGLANLGVACGARSSQVAIIRNNLDHYLVATHELGHLLSVDHDEDTDCKQNLGVMGAFVTGTMENFVWSSCAKSSMQNYFSNRKSRCLQSCPQTNPNCGNRPPSFTDEISCIIYPSQVCKKNGKIVAGRVSCEDGMICSDGVKAEYNYCVEGLLPEEMKRYCKLMDDVAITNGIVTPARNGLICNSSDPNNISVCYQRKCVPVDRIPPLCESA